MLIDHSLYNALQQKMQGSIHTDKATRSMYATDASIYRELPIAVAYPKTKEDLQLLISFATEQKLSLIPRTAGTSLAGQCVGQGIVVDVSKHFTKIIELNVEERWILVQPGVVRDELNLYLKSHGLLFGPNTSTANRAMIGGMVGNNSCGSYSIVYGDTRKHTLEVCVLMHDGTEAVFHDITHDEIHRILQEDTAEATVYKHIIHTLSDKDTQELIRNEFPKAAVHRRNTGYAIDELIQMQPFTPNGKKLNLAKLIAGSEGSLCFITEIKLSLDPLPPKESMLICAHYHSLDDALKAVVKLMPLAPRALELMDNHILECTKGQAQYNSYRTFVDGEPNAILIIEIAANTTSELENVCATYVDCIKSTHAYSIPVIKDTQAMRKVWKLREAGLGLLANFPGDAKPVAVIEDTAVEVADLPEYIREFDELMTQYNQTAVYYAHAGAGELHIRPVLNLKTREGVTMLRTIATDSAKLVKKYKGSLSGEHGDGRVRGEFIPIMIGNELYQLLRSIKATWDPNKIFNPGKITDTPPMDSSLRYEADVPTPEIETHIDFGQWGGVLRAAEKCNGSADCRKTELIGGTMCPSYMATRNEKDTTRARANILREFLTHSEKKNRFNHEEIKEVLDLCLSCKGCKAECPSNVDIALLKAEFLYQYQKENGASLSAWAMAHIATGNRFGMYARTLTNFLLRNHFTSSLIKQTLQVAPQRQLPLLAATRFSKWFTHYKQQVLTPDANKTVYVFVDEFTEFNDVDSGIHAVKLLNHLGYTVLGCPLHNSGRAYISKGFLDEARQVAEENIQWFSKHNTNSLPIIGIEPSCILGFRDEYPKLLRGEWQEKAKTISMHTFMIDEFLYQEMKKGNLRSDVFKKDAKPIRIHGHCHQKAMGAVDYQAELLHSLLGVEAHIIPSGCCGMAGSFGYEKAHYDISMQVGELVLFPDVRKHANTHDICASGTSCRHQIQDGTGHKAMHIVDILYSRIT